MPKLHSERREKYESKKKGPIEKQSLSKYIHKASASQKQRGKKREKNTYQFVGFYQRLKNIDVKASHASLLNQEHKMDHAFSADSDDNYQDSNFIQLLQSERVNNASPEFKRVWKALDHLAYSFPLLILNRTKIVNKLLQQLGEDSFKPVYARIIELLIALIKDLRQDIYPDFVQRILPSCVQILDIENPQVMDSVFSLFSFSFKYLLQPLREDIQRFYPIYVELLSHKNKYIRKFSAQAFSYVLRKVSFTDVATVQILINYVHSQDNLLGLTDLVYEACQGQQQELHSKSEEILKAFLNNEWSQSEKGHLFIRFLFIKLVNNIDTQKQLPIFNLLSSQQNFSLTLSVLSDAVKLKFGRRVSPEIAKLFIVTIRDNLRSNPSTDQTKALSYLYYFLHSTVYSQYEKVFTHLLFQQGEELVFSFYKLLLQNPDSITTETDLPLNKLLDLQSSNIQVQFSKESHQQKHSLLLASLHKWTLKQISIPKIELFLMAIQASGQSELKVEIAGSAQGQLDQLIKNTSKLEEIYIISRFVNILVDKEKWTHKIRLQSSQSDKDLTELNFPEILEKYQNISNLRSDAALVIDIHNHGFAYQLPILTKTLLEDKVELTKENTHLYFVLKQAFCRGVTIKEPQLVEQQLAQNLSLNSREMRILSLQLLVKEFGQQNYISPPADTKLTADQIKQHYAQDMICPVYTQLLDCEKYELSMQTEKQKSNLMRRVVQQIETGLCPASVVEAAYHYAVGCFWVKFSPLFQPAHDILQCLLPEHPKHHCNLIKLISTVGHLLHFSDDKSELVELLCGQQAKSSLALFISDSKPSQDFVSVGDFYSNIVKAVQLDSCFNSAQLTEEYLTIIKQLVQFEYTPLFKPQAKKELEFREAVMQANTVDSDNFKQARRTTAFKLQKLIESVASSSSLNKIGSNWSQYMCHFFMEFVADERYQKDALQGLLKMTKSQQEGKGGFQANWTVKLPKYQKLLEGLADEQKFKDMIPVITHGSQTTQIQELQDDGDVVMEETQKAQKKESGSIPRLIDEDRAELLPLIVKLLLSKLTGRKLKKTIDRRTYVYQFLASLNPQTEYHIFFAQVLEPLALKSHQVDDVKRALTQVSFGTFVTFIGTLDVIFTQLGTLMVKAGQGYLQLFMQILILMLAQSKMFLGTLSTINKEVEGEGIYQFVSKQCNTCTRSCLKIIKQLYHRFYRYPDFIREMTVLFYTSVVDEELQYLEERYIHQSSNLVEVLTHSWSLYAISEYTKYEKVLPCLLSMLKHQLKPEVCQQILAMLKNIVLQSIQQSEQRLTLIKKSKELMQLEEQNEASLSFDDNDDNEDDQQESDQSSSEEDNLCANEVAKELLTNHIVCISQSLQSFWQANSHKLKNALVGGQGNSPRAKNLITEQIQLTASVRDLLFIMSELSGYIGVQLTPNEKDSFLEMMLGLLSHQKLIQASSSHNQKSNKLEDLLLFGLTAVTNLLPKTSTHLLKVSDFFLHLQSKPARQLLAYGFHKIFQCPSTQVLLLLNTVKKGLADIDYDFEKVLEGVQQVPKLSDQCPALIYCTLNLTRHAEYSVRESALHALSQISFDNRTFKQTEQFFFSSLKILKDEMLLRSALIGLKTLTLKSQPQSQCFELRKLLGQEGQDDFFTQVLSLTLPSRLKALRKCSTLDIDQALFSKVVLPLVDFLTTDMLHQQENRRSNTVRYTKDQANQLQEEALDVYTSYAKGLSAGQYFSLVRKLLYKIERFQRQSQSVAALKTDSLQERMYCKCLCKVLDGFNFPQVPDAVDLLKQQQEEQVVAKKDKKEQVVEYSNFLKEMVGDTIIDSDAESDYSKDDSDEEQQDIQMDQEVTSIQNKLRQKVLPLLQRHLTQKKKDHTTIRGFVALTIAKVIRRLPVDQFKLHLHKLINLIVVKGLRERDLNTRDKARKALLQVVDEVSPRFITTIVGEMQSNLDRGFQLHVYLYTVHIILQHLKEKNSLQTGQITSQLIKLLSPLLLREMFGDLMEERKAADSAQNAKKHIKESKARKAMPVYEVLAQYSDFKHSFLDLVQPIVKVLEENPTQQAMAMTEELLQRVAQSVLKNQSISATQLLPFLKQIIERGVQMAMRTKINDEKSKRDYGAKAGSNYIHKSEAQLKLETMHVEANWVKTGQLAGDKKTQEICGRVLANFGLQTLKKSFGAKGLILDHDDKEKTVVKQDLLVLIDPFVQPLLDSFKTYHNPIVVQTLMILQNVIHLNLPSFPPLLKKFLNRIFNLFLSNTSADNEFTNSLFKCTAELIRTYAVYQDLSSDQITTLVKIVQNNLQNYSTQASVFTCLRAILNRKFESGELYDLMQSVQDMMVTSVQQTTRQTCASLFIHFILEYPLGQERLDTHIQHLLKNLSYSNQDGRLQLLEVLYLILEKIPLSKMQQWQDLIFVTLFLRIVNESFHKCREMITKLLKTLIVKSNKKYTDALWQMDTTDSTKKRQMLNGKIQVLALIAEANKMHKTDIAKSVEFVSEIVGEIAEKTLRDSRKQEKNNEESEDMLDQNHMKFLKGIGLDSSSEEEEPEEDQSRHETQDCAFFALKCIEAIINSDQKATVLSLIQQKAALTNSIVLLAWKSTNYWCRLVSLRLISLLLQSNSFAALFLANSEDLLKFGYKLANVLSFAHVTSEMTDALSKCLIHTLTCVDAQIGVKVVKKASFIGRRILGDKSDQTRLKHSMLLKVYKEFTQTLTQKNQLAAVVPAMLDLVYRTYSDDSLAQELRDQSHELVDLWANTLDKEVFVSMFSQAQQQVSQQRVERKMALRLKVTNEEGLGDLARRRQNKLEKKRLKHKETVLRSQLTR